MSMLKRLQERGDEITTEMSLIESKAGGHNRGMSSGELSRLKELAGILRQINLKIEAALTEEDLKERIAQATPAGMFADF